jgi:tRNA 2-selenouridine synthase
LPVDHLRTADLASLAGFDAVIDVRSPAEFADDHAPGAINLPVLSNDERTVVGTIYVQQSRFTARRLGAAIIARNVAAHLEGPLADKPGSFRPLVYCWRGGQRSHAMATILSEVGWRTTVLDGGYRTWRRHVTARLYDGALGLRFVVIDGQTGTGKTEVLARLAAAGAQVLDLEDIAAHRGSLFGALPGRPQPSQKLFESELLAQIDGFDPDRPVFVEAESSKVGERMIPPALWSRMALAPRSLWPGRRRAPTTWLRSIATSWPTGLSWTRCCGGCRRRRGRSGWPRGANSPMLGAGRRWPWS